ncbi:MAG: cardiolipin synthase ClsB, partial [Gammaproteobacteria bacterium]
GEEYYPRLFAAIDRARSQVLVETFIWFEDNIGTEFAQHLITAARRGVEVRVTADAYGTPGFSSEFLDTLREAGVTINAFDPRPTFFKVRTNMLCRLHQKIAVIDGREALIGGINISDDHLREYGELSKQDFAVAVTGPVVKQIHEFVANRSVTGRGFWWRRWRYWLRRFPRQLGKPALDSQVLFAIRDNSEHPTDIETLYRIAIRNAEREIVIANAYFFPGYRFIRDLLRAQRRGVDVKLIMQGSPDRPVTIGAASVLYDDLVAAGVRIYRFTERPLHAKVAVIDDHWATIGSSNLDPTSLGLNYEANLFILDGGFNTELKQRLQRLIDESCQVYEPTHGSVSYVRRMLAAGAYHLTRRMATWGRRAVRRQQRTEPL